MFCSPDVSKDVSIKYVNEDSKSHSRHTQGNTWWKLWKPSPKAKNPTSRLSAGLIFLSWDEIINEFGRQWILMQRLTCRTVSCHKYALLSWSAMWCAERRRSDKHPPKRTTLWKFRPRKARGPSWGWLLRSPPSNASSICAGTWCVDRLPNRSCRLCYRTSWRQDVFCTKASPCVRRKIRDDYYAGRRLYQQICDARWVDETSLN